MLSVMIALLLALLCIGGMGAMLSAARLEWRGTWHGHEVIVRNYLTNEQLYIDGKLVAESKSAGLAFSATLPSVIDDNGRAVPVLATIHPANLGLSIGAQLFVDGEAVALERAPVESFDLGRPEATTDAAGAPVAAAAAPRDTRWAAVQHLLSDIRARGTDTDGVIEQVESQLRSLLAEITALAEQREIHRALDEEFGGDGVAGLEVIRSQREEQARQLIAAVQQLHLAVLQGQHDVETDALRALHARLSVEAELHGDDPRERARRAAAARKQRT